MSKINDRIKSIFQLMEYEELTDDQHKLIVSFEEQFNHRGSLTPRQYEILESIFEQAASKVEWSR